MSTDFFYLTSESSPAAISRGKVDWCENGFNITIVGADSAFAGNITDTMIEEKCESLNVSKEQYLNQCKTAILSKWKESEFHYSLTDDCFLIKKRLRTETSITINVVFLKVDLHRISYGEAIIEMLDAAINSNKIYAKQINQIVDENDSLKRDNKLATEHLRKAEEHKISLEQTLYRKFLNLLNSKKSNALHSPERYTSEQCEKQETMVAKEKKPILDDDIFEVDTDIDDIEENVTIMRHSPLHSDTSIGEDKSHEPIISEKIHQPIISQKTPPKTESISRSLSFLDPTIPF